MASLNPAASAFIPASSTTPLVSYGTPFTASCTPRISSGSAFAPSSALSPASQQVLAGELEALERREERHARLQNQQQQCRNGLSPMAQSPINIYQLQSFEEKYGYQQMQAQYQAQYQMQYQQLYEQTWIPSHNPIPAQQIQTYQEFRGPANQSFAGNQLEPQSRNQNYVGTKHPPQAYTPSAQRVQLLRQAWDRDMETTIYPPPLQPFQDARDPQAPQMTKKQIWQMEEAIPTTKMGMQMMQACNSDEVVQIRHSDNMEKKTTIAQYAAPKSEQPVYVPHVPSKYHQYQQLVYDETQAYPQEVVHQGNESQQQQQPYEQQSTCQRGVSSHVPLYMHKRELEIVPGYEGYSIYPKRKVVRPGRVFAQVEESSMPADRPRERLPRAESSPPHLRNRKGGIPHLNPDLTPTRRHTDDGRNNGYRSNEENSLAHEAQQYRRRQPTTIRTGNGDANDRRYCQYLREIYSSNAHNVTQCHELEQIDEKKRSVRAKREGKRESTPDRELYSPCPISRGRQKSPAEYIPATNVIAGSYSSANNLHSQRHIPFRQQEPRAEESSTTGKVTGALPILDNLHEETTDGATNSSATIANPTICSPRSVTPTPTRPQTVADLSFAPAATSPVMTHSFPCAPKTLSGQPLKLPVPRTNPLASVFERVAHGEVVPSDTMGPHNLATQSVVSQIEANARAATARGRGEITYMDGGKYWVERKKAGKNAWEMEGWKVGGAGERPGRGSQGAPKKATHEGRKQDKKQKKRGGARGGDGGGGGSRER